MVCSAPKIAFTLKGKTFFGKTHFAGKGNPFAGKPFFGGGARNLEQHERARKCGKIKGGKPLSEEQTLLREKGFAGKPFLREKILKCGTHFVKKA